MFSYLSEYCRVAHDDSFSLEAQAAQLRRYAEQAGYTIIGATAEQGNGLALDRPGLEKVTQAVLAGEVDIQLEGGQLGRQHGEAVLAGGERQCAAIIPLHENLTLIVHKVYFALRAGKNGMIRVLHRIKPDAGAGGILLLDEIHHFSLHTHIPPIVMPCLGVF